MDDTTPLTRPALQHTNPTRRLSTEIDLGVASDHNFYNGFSADLTDGGLFVATYQTYAVGDRLRVRFRLPGIDDPIEAKVEVKWIRSVDAGDEGAPGFGAAFIELDDAGRAAVERFTQHREPLFFAE